MCVCVCVCVCVCASGVCMCVWQTGGYPPKLLTQNLLNHNFPKTWGLSCIFGREGTFLPLERLQRMMNACGWDVSGEPTSNILPFSPFCSAASFFLKKKSAIVKTWTVC